MGFTMLLRIPGTIPEDGKIKAIKLVISSYLPTDKLDGLGVECAIAKIIQEFGEDIACPHLLCLEGMFKADGAVPPLHCIPGALGPEFPLLPKPEAIHGRYYKFAGLTKGVYRDQIILLDEEEYKRAAATVDWEAGIAMMEKLE